MLHTETVLILDFGSQVTQLIARRLREMGFYSEIKHFSTPIEQIQQKNGNLSEYMCGCARGGSGEVTYKRPDPAQVKQGPIVRAEKDVGAVQDFLGVKKNGMWNNGTSDAFQRKMEEIQRGIEGNLCRCTGYVKIIDAIEAASKE
jgi:hypothetical protein